jgi:hypothetical protein
VFVGGNICGRSMMQVRKEYNDGKLKVRYDWNIISVQLNTYMSKIS